MKFSALVAAREASRSQRSARVGALSPAYCPVLAAALSAWPGEARRSRVGGAVWSQLNGNGSCHHDATCPVVSSECLTHADSGIY